MPNCNYRKATTPFLMKVEEYCKCSLIQKKTQQREVGIVLKCDLEGAFSQGMTCLGIRYMGMAFVNEDNHTLRTTVCCKPSALSLTTHRN